MRDFYENDKIPIKRVKRELKYKGAIVNFYQDEIELPDQRLVYWDFIEHVNGAAAVVAVQQDGKLLMVKQFRNAIDRFTLELPAGARQNPNEHTSLCAARELEEETGYRSDNLEFLVSLKTTVAFCNELIDVYVARELIPSKQMLDDDEFIEIEAYELETLCQWIYEGKIQDAKTIAGIMAYKNKYSK